MANISESTPEPQQTEQEGGIDINEINDSKVVEKGLKYEFVPN